MDRLHARYPFLDAAREAVQRAEVDLAALVAREDSAAVERGVDRLETAIGEGRVGDGHRRPRVELLSYPIARTIVSMVDRPELVRVYARAEARTARERFVADLEGDDLKSTSDGRITLGGLLDEFDLSGAVTRADADRFRVEVGPYLSLSADLDGENWRLATRDLDDGTVPVDREELYDLLTEAVRESVTERLPLSVPDAVADHLTDEVDRIEAALADRTVPRGIDVVVPGLFPPCVRALLTRVKSGERLPEHSRFSLFAFLAGIGMDADEIAALCDLDAEEVAYRVERIRSEAGTDYAPPSCEAMVAYGDCVNKDDLCTAIAHPLEYYDRRIDDAPDPTDWRERQGAD